ncbi:MAG: hypothetical protein KAI47_21570, partial [Deltaproteobacteria bacterium]|nr:hypothetical protein [Deltaproteobacteria bacterium]
DRYVQNYRDLLGTYLLDHAALTRFAHRGPLNTDLTPRLTFSAAHAAYENRSRLAWESLAAIWPLRVPCPPRLFDAPQEAQAKAKVAISRWARAVDLYMRADLQRVQAKTIHYPPGAVSKLLDAYDVEPSFSPARGLLLKIAAANGPEADRIFQRLIARTPDNLRVQGTYAQSLLRRGKTREALEIQKKIQQAIQAQPPHRTPK